MYRTTASDQRTLILSIAVSIAVHLILLVTLTKPYLPKQSSRLNSLEVEIIPAPAAVTKSSLQKAPEQIVSPPNKAESQTPNVETNLRSEKDSATSKQQIKRGDDPQAAMHVASTKSSHATSSNQKPVSKVEQANNQSPGRIKTFKLDSQTLIDRFGEVSQASKPSEQQELARQPSEMRAFSRPAGSGARFVGQSGTNDYLPDLPDGDLTLLNAKADRFAVFVRRVALQVFAALRESGWEKLSARDIEILNNFNSFSAVINKDGHLLSVQLQNSAGNSRFDEIVAIAIKKGAHDPHPPEAAQASDGNIRFIFKARSWSTTAITAKTGAAFERRWLVLATGLE